MKKHHKKAKKKGRIILIVLLIFICAVLFILFRGNFLGNIFGNNKEVMAQVEEFLAAYQRQDEDTVTELMYGGHYGDDSVSFEGYSGIVGSRIQYDIQRTEKTDDMHYTVYAEITSLDFPKLAEDETFLSRITKDNVLQAIEEEISGGKAPTTVYEVPIQMIMEDGTWKVLIDQTLSNALLGGFGTFYMQMTEEMAGDGQ